MYRCVTKLCDLEKYIGNNKTIALDIETSPTNTYRNEDKSALNAHKSTITGISFSILAKAGIYIPFCHKTGMNANFSQIWDWIKDNILMNQELTVVIHNAAFETMFFYALNCVPQCKIYDTLAAAQLTLKTKTEFRKLSDCGLKKLVPELLEIELPKFSEVLSQAKKSKEDDNLECELPMSVAHFDELNAQDTETIRYACSDSDYALQLYEIFNEWFDKYLPKHRYIAEQIESPTAVYVGLMKYNGVLMDTELMLKKQEEAAKQIQELKEDIKFMTSGVDIGSNASTKAFKNYLYKDLGLPVLKATEKSKEVPAGSPSVDDEALILLSDWCVDNKPDLVPLFEMITSYRKWNKLKSTYICGYLKFVDKATNRIHADLMPLATETGRFASRNPNLQNCPRKNNDPIGIRNFIVAPEGKALISLDFSQIELRVGAFYCRDKKMLETYHKNGDIHAQTTSVIFNIPFEQAVNKDAEHYKERRTIAKNCNFGVFFGLFPKGLQKTLKFKTDLNKTLEECTEIIKNLKAGYPMLENWQNGVKKHASCLEYTETYLGRRRYLPNINSVDWSKKSFSQRCALNTPIQGTAADILKLAMGRIIKGLPDRMWLRPLLQIHDELIFEVPEDKVNEAVVFVKECMEAEPFTEARAQAKNIKNNNGFECELSAQTLRFDVPIIAEASVGNNFGNLKDLKGSEALLPYALQCSQLESIKDKSCLVKGELL